MEFADWTRAFVMMAHDGTVYRPVLVDELGNLYALLQGKTAEGALQTVRLDDEGRMSAFVIDSTDAWGRMLSIGNAELAVRLGSPVRYDKRGEVFEIVTFSEGFNRCYTEASNGAPQIRLSPEMSLSGGYSAEFVLDAVVGSYGRIFVTRASAPLGRVGFEIGFHPAQQGSYVQLSIECFTGTRRVEGAVRLDMVGSKLEYYDSGEVWREVEAAVVTSALPNAFSFLKLVLDVENEMYVRLLYSKQEHDLSTYPTVAEDSPAAPAFNPWLRIENQTAVAQSVFVDNLVSTFAEP